MLPKNIRFDLRESSTFFDDARAWRGDGVTVLYQPQLSPTRPATTRMAIVIPKGVAKGAQRIKIKRLLRHAIIQLFNQQPHLFTLPYDVVVIARGRVRDFSTYVLSLAHALREIAD